MKLNHREIELMTYIANGKTAKEIARLTGLEHRTVETYMISIRKKLAAKNIAHAVYIACHQNIFTDHLAFSSPA